LSSCPGRRTRQLASLNYPLFGPGTRFRNLGRSWRVYLRHPIMAAPSSRRAALAATSFVSLRIFGGRCRLELTGQKRLVMRLNVFFFGFDNDIFRLNGVKGAFFICTALFRSLSHNAQRLRVFYSNFNLLRLFILLGQQVLKIELVGGLPVLVLVVEVVFFLFSIVVVLGALFFRLFSGILNVLVWN
jgi:hypothetical protein